MRRTSVIHATIGLLALMMGTGCLQSPAPMIEGCPEGDVFVGERVRITFSAGTTPPNVRSSNGSVSGVRKLTDALGTATYEAFVTPAMPGAVKITFGGDPNDPNRLMPPDDKVACSFNAVATSAKLEGLNTVLTALGSELFAQRLTPTDEQTEITFFDVLRDISIDERTPAESQEINCIGASLQVLVAGAGPGKAINNKTGATAQDRVGTAFPCGQGDNGFTVCASSILGCTYEEQVLVVSATFAGDIPLNDPSRQYQYAFVFDSDGVASNNYVPPPEFAGDFFAGSDRWYSADYNRTDGWLLTVSDVVNNQPTPATSCARIIFRENAMVLVVPRSEFVVEKPSYRVTAFSADPDFSRDNLGSWSGDQEPKVGEPLQVID